MLTCGWSTITLKGLLTMYDVCVFKHGTCTGLCCPDDVFFSSAGRMETPSIVGKLFTEQSSARQTIQSTSAKSCSLLKESKVKK